MITLEYAKEQLLSQIEMELSRIYPAGSDAPEKLEEFYDHISELPLSNTLFAWCRLNAGNVRIKCIGEEVCIYKAEQDDQSPSRNIVGRDGPDGLDELIDQALGNGN
jgi:hypothetical protein